MNTIQHRPARILDHQILVRRDRATLDVAIWLAIIAGGIVAIAACVYLLTSCGTPDPSPSPACPAKCATLDPPADCDRLCAVDGGARD